MHLKFAVEWFRKARIPAAVFLIVAMETADVRSRFIAHAFSYSNSARIYGVAFDEGYWWSYIGRRYMPNHDGEGLIHWASAPPVRPLDRIGIDQGVYFPSQDPYVTEDAWGTAYDCFVVAFWKLSAILSLMLVRRPLAMLEIEYAPWFRSRRRAARTDPLSAAH